MRQPILSPKEETKSPSAPAKAVGAETTAADAATDEQLSWTLASLRQLEQAEEDQRASQSHSKVSQPPAPLPRSAAHRARRHCRRQSDIRGGGVAGCCCCCSTPPPLVAVESSPQRLIVAHYSLSLSLSPPLLSLVQYDKAIACTYSERKCAINALVALLIVMFVGAAIAKGSRRRNVHTRRSLRRSVVATAAPSFAADETYTIDSDMLLGALSGPLRDSMIYDDGSGEGDRDRGGGGGERPSLPEEVVGGWGDEHAALRPAKVVPRDVAASPTGAKQLAASEATEERKRVTTDRFDEDERKIASALEAMAALKADGRKTKQGARVAAVAAHPRLPALSIFWVACAPPSPAPLTCSPLPRPPPSGIRKMIEAIDREMQPLKRGILEEESEIKLLRRRVKALEGALSVKGQVSAVAENPLAAPSAAAHSLRPRVPPPSAEVVPPRTRVRGGAALQGSGSESADVGDGGDAWEAVAAQAALAQAAERKREGEGEEDLALSKPYGDEYYY